MITPKCFSKGSIGMLIKTMEKVQFNIYSRSYETEKDRHNATQEYTKVVIALEGMLKTDDPQLDVVEEFTQYLL